MIHVPYKGSAPAITDLVGGHVPIMFDSAIAILPQIKAGKVKAIAITSGKRSSVLPDVPTFAEAGMPGFESYAWYGFFAPAKTPPDIIAKLNAAAIKCMKTARMAEGARGHRLGERRGIAAAVRRLHQGRGDEVGEGREGERRDDRLTGLRVG